VAPSKKNVQNWPTYQCLWLSQKIIFRKALPLLQSAIECPEKKVNQPLPLMATGNGWWLNGKLGENGWGVRDDHVEFFARWKIIPVITTIYHGFSPYFAIIAHYTKKKKMGTFHKRINFNHVSHY